MKEFSLIIFTLICLILFEYGISNKFENNSYYVIAIIGLIGFTIGLVSVFILISNY